MKSMIDNEINGIFESSPKRWNIHLGSTTSIMTAYV